MRPSDLLGIGRSDEPGADYVAYCLDEAIQYCGMTIEAELDKAGHKVSKDERKIVSAREGVLKKYLGDQGADSAPKKFADPMNLF